MSEASANALLSDLRPTTLSITTLAHLNALLDELLVSIVSSARSINLTHLRTRGASAILTADGQPGEHASLGALGRAAVGEAEVEIRSWYEGHPTARKGVSGFPPNGQGRGLTADAEETGKPFPVLAAVELMRFKVGTLAVSRRGMREERRPGHTDSRSDLGTRPEISRGQKRGRRVGEGHCRRLEARGRRRRRGDNSTCWTVADCRAGVSVVVCLQLLLLLPTHGPC